MSDFVYRVRVLVSDGRPGLIPFTYDTHAESRDKAISAVRKNVRRRSNGAHVVKHVDSARKGWTNKRGSIFGIPREDFRRIH